VGEVIDRQAKRVTHNGKEHKKKKKKKREGKKELILPRDVPCK